MSTKSEAYKPTKWKFVYKTHRLFRIFYATQDISIQYYLPETTTEDELFRSLNKSFLEVNISQRDTNYMLKDWHENARKKEQIKNRTPIKMHKDNAMGYLGVAISFNLKSFRIFSQIYRDKKIITKKGSTIKINEVKENLYSISLGKTEDAFVQSCKSSDDLRGRERLTREDYLKLMKLPNFKKAFQNTHKVHNGMDFDVEFTLTK
jgi:hypothetical protein